MENPGEALRGLKTWMGFGERVGVPGKSLAQGEKNDFPRESEDFLVRAGWESEIQAWTVKGGSRGGWVDPQMQTE